MHINFSILVLWLVVLTSIGLGGLKAEKKSDPRTKTIGVIVNMEINNIDLPLENKGSTGDGGNAFYPNGTSLSFLFYGGIATTAYLNSELRASWMAPSSIIEEWQAGKWGMDPNDTSATFYAVNATDGPGSPAYIDWAYAVALGADFQDLDGDGFYDPMIDKPDILGDRSYWTVISDSTPMAQRIPRLGTPPIGLEIHQQAWAFQQAGELGNVIFIRYRMINATNDDKDSVIFSIWTDPDIGDYTDDLVGCDPEDDLGFSYNDGEDGMYGSNPPAFGIQLLQGPIVDAPGDTAYHYRGPYFGTDTIFDKINLPMTSFSYYIGADPTLGDPSRAINARYYQLGGFDMSGNPIVPSQWGIGGTSHTNPDYFYSGDPVTMTGWLDTTPSDIRFLLNSGPFQMAVGDTQDIIVAYVLGRGNDALNSLTEMRTNAAAARYHLGILTGFDDDQSVVLENYQLYQNYPNPFNPSTIIQFELPKSSQVTLDLYNIRGQRIATLLSASLLSGSHSIEFDASHLSSGVYLYHLQAGDHVEIKKMVVMK